MKTLHFDCFAGISGDMTLGALVDLGVDPGDLRRELEKLGLEGWKLEFRREQRCGIGGVYAEVVLEGSDDHLAHDGPDHHGRHGPESADHHGGHHHHDSPGDCPHRSWKEIRDLISQSGVNAGAKRRALDMFGLIAQAEAQVHGVSPDEVAFHEVGALDSIIDIVGVAVGLELLKPERISCGEVELGGGMVRCAHGVLPVPAPATLILVRDMPVKTGGFNAEMTTPTGAAILAASVDEFVRSGSFRELATGYGAGRRQMEKPNLLRLSWREEAGLSAPEEDWKTEELILMETNIDDMSGEALGFLMENLFEAGALDVTLSPCVMKKSRPGTIVAALAAPERLDALRRTFFERSSAIGFRETPVRRRSLVRENQTVTGPFGEARRKAVFMGKRPLGDKIEFEDRARLARERRLSLDQAERIIRAEGSIPAGTDGEG